jgi:hypothetical protein
MHYGGSKLGVSVPADAGGAQSGFDCYAPACPRPLADISTSSAC